MKRLLSRWFATPQAGLPFAALLPVLAGAAVGIVLRLLYSAPPGKAFTAMAFPFVYLVPAAVGAITVYVAERIRRRSWAYYFRAPAFANMLFVLGTLAILVEGLICAILVVPLFALIGGLGGLVMGLVCRLTNWPRQAVYSFALLPLLLGGVGGDGTSDPLFGVVERRLVIAAAPDRVWRHIHDARDIRSDEVGRAWMYRIGVPLPLAGVTEETPEGRVRKVTMGKSVHFDQVEAESVPQRYVRWTYRFAPDSFPPAALDDHVVIGGHYFDLVDTSYALTPHGAGQTELAIQMRYRISTQFNWYAGPIARLLIGNFEEVILRFYAGRAETPA